MSTEPFSFIRDFRRVQWGPTLQVNLLRASGAGLVVGVLGLIPFFGSVFDGAPGVAWPLLVGPVTGPLTMPVAYLVILLPLGILGGIINAATSKMDNIVGTTIGLVAAAFILFAAITVMIGDPIIYFLHKYRPKWVPVDRYQFVNFCMILYVLHPVEER